MEGKMGISFCFTGRVRESSKNPSDQDHIMVGPISWLEPHWKRVEWDQAEDGWWQPFKHSWADRIFAPSVAKCHPTDMWKTGRECGQMHESKYKKNPHQSSPNID